MTMISENEPTEPNATDAVDTDNLDSSEESNGRQDDANSWRERFEQAKRDRDDEKRKRREMSDRLKQYESRLSEFEKAQEREKKSQLEKKGQYEVLLEEVQKEREKFASGLLAQVREARMEDLKKKVQSAVGGDDPQYMELALHQVADKLSLLGELELEDGGSRLPSLQIESEAVDAAVKVLRKDFPRLFRSKTAGGEPVTPKVTDAGPPDMDDPAKRVFMLAQKYSHAATRRKSQ
jgi:hypothetical protein